MLLSQSQIREALERAELQWTGELRGDSLLATLGGPIREFAAHGRVVDPLDAGSLSQLYGEQVAEWAEYLIEPGSLVLAQIRERLTLGDTTTGYISGMSHVARLGLEVHLASPWVGRHFGARVGGGHLVLELVNHAKATILLRPDMPVATIRLLRSGGGAGGDAGIYGELGDLASHYGEEFGGGR